MAGGISEEIIKPQSNAIPGLLFNEICWELQETDVWYGNNRSVLLWDVLDKT